LHDGHEIITSNYSNLQVRRPEFLPENPDKYTSWPTGHVENVIPHISGVKSDFITLEFMGSLCKDVLLLPPWVVRCIVEIKDRTVLVLGGAGLVGLAVCRELLALKPAKLIVSSLLAHETEAAVRLLKKNLPDSETEFV
jgi:hypothetical protein